MTDRIDRTLTLLWAVMGVAIVLKPEGYLGWTDLTLWILAAWLVACVGLCYLRSVNGRA